MKRPVTTDARLPYRNELRAKGVMSCEEIKWWIREFSTNPAWNWTRNKTNLARALGFNNHPLPTMNGKLKTAWIYPTEQVRLSERIRLIRDGYLVPYYNIFPHSFEYANPPRPPVRPPTKMTVHTVAGGARLTLEPPETPTPRMPDFKNIFKNALLWKTD